MAAEDIEPRVKSLEERVETHEARITTHGREIDQHGERIIRLEMEGRARDETLARIEKNQNEQGGKIDALLMKPANAYEDIKGKLVWLVVAAVASFLLGRFGV